MTSAELEAFIERQVQQNPALEIVMESGAENFRAPAADVCVEEVDGENSISFPLPATRLRLRESYVQALTRAETPAEERESIKARVRAAVDLLRNIEHRLMCIGRVTEYLVRSQPDSWRSEPKFIKPVSREEAARATEMAEATVSVVVANKLMWTPHGVLELRRFFPDG